MQRSEQVNEIAAALAKAQAKMEYAERDTKNPFFNSTYADLASVWEACRVPLTENGLSVVQFPSADGPKVTVDTMLLHTSGQWFSSTLTAISKKDDAQGIGSVITYLRRYSLQSMVGVAPVDDDGNVGSGHEPQMPVKQPRKPDAKAATPPLLTEEDAKYIATTNEDIINSKTRAELRLIGDHIKTKSPAIKNALRGLYESRLETLEPDSETSQPKTPAA